MNFRWKQASPVLVALICAVLLSTSSAAAAQNREPALELISGARRR